MDLGKKVDQSQALPPPAAEARIPALPSVSTKKEILEMLPEESPPRNPDENPDQDELHEVASGNLRDEGHTLYGMALALRDEKEVAAFLDSLGAMRRALDLQKRGQLERIPASVPQLPRLASVVALLRSNPSKDDIVIFENSLSELPSLVKRAYGSPWNMNEVQKATKTIESRFLEPKIHSLSGRMVEQKRADWHQSKGLRRFWNSLVTFSGLKFDEKAAHEEARQNILDELNTRPTLDQKLQYLDASDR